MTRKTQAQWHRQEQRNADRTVLPGGDGEGGMLLDGHVLGRVHVHWPIGIEILTQTYKKENTSPKLK